MARSKAIMGYGTDDDRLKLEAIATLSGLSSSQWIIQQIRAAYDEVYGDTPPSNVVKDDQDEP